MQIIDFVRYCFPILPPEDSRDVKPMYPFNFPDILHAVIEDSLNERLVPDQTYWLV